MRKFSRRRSYHSRGIDETKYSEATFEREKKLKDCEALICEGCLPDLAFDVIGISKATYYRWKKRYEELGLLGLEDEDRRPRRTRKPLWGTKEEALVTQLRKKYPTWGKNKIKVLLERDHQTYLSVSTVGRIIKKLVQKGRIYPTSYFSGSAKRKKRRPFTGYAQRWKYGMKSDAPGQLVQIDHMTVRLDNGSQIKHFDAICPFTKVVFAKAYSCATSNIAAQFLSDMTEKSPFPISSIQVDGGSEFMGDFEVFCEKNNLGLFVLPPRRPQYNGSVERANGTMRYEFYQFYEGKCSLGPLNQAIEQFLFTYNNIRPHQALDYKTPLQFYQNLLLKGGSNEPLMEGKMEVIFSNRERIYCKSSWLGDHLESHMY